MPPSRSTMVQENTRTSPLVQNGRMTSRNSTCRDRPLVARASATAAGRPIAAHSPVVQNPSFSDVQAVSSK